MSRNLQYVGVADRRIVTAGDLTKLGLEDSDFTKTTFEPGYDYEVDDEVAEVLLENATFRGEFKDAEEASPKSAGTPVDSEAGVESSRSSQSEGTGATGTAGTTGTTGTGTRTTGGTSTAGAGRKGRGGSTRTR